MPDNKDKKILDWLIKRVSYLDHTGPDGTPSREAYPGPGGYWPVSEGDVMPDTQMVGLGLSDYVLKMIEREGGDVDNLGDGGVQNHGQEVEEIKLAIYGFMIAHFNSLSTEQVGELAGIVKGVGK